MPSLIDDMAVVSEMAAREIERAFLWIALAGLAAVAAFAAAADATQYSCLSIVTAAKRIGKWDALKAWIAASGLRDEWEKCSYVSDDSPQYAAATNALVAGGVLTAAEVAAVLAESVDPAVPDDLLRRAYAEDMKSLSGRVRWHGAVTNTVFDRAALVKRQFHADGYVHEEAFRESAPPSVQAQLSAAERKALAKERRRRAAQDRERKRLARVAIPTTNMTAEVQKAMASKRWPEDLAEAYLRHELNTLVGTNVVGATVTPQSTRPQQ